MKIFIHMSQFVLESLLSMQFFMYPATEYNFRFRKDVETDIVNLLETEIEDGILELNPQDVDSVLKSKYCFYE